MAVAKQYKSDVDAILARRHDNGGDYWATPDRRLIKGSPFTTLESAFMLSDLGMLPSEPVLKETANLILSSWREDGRFKLSPQGAIYPCHTINAARVLCHLGYAADSRLRRTFDHLLEIQHSDGGWRCKKFSFGRGPETEFSNPGPTLSALDAFRFTSFINQNESLDKAVEFLLEHWVTRKPLGPCHYGIGPCLCKLSILFLNITFFSMFMCYLSTTRQKKTGDFWRRLKF